MSNKQVFRNSFGDELELELFTENNIVTAQLYHKRSDTFWECVRLSESPHWMFGPLINCGHKIEVHCFNKFKEQELLVDIREHIPQCIAQVNLTPKQKS